METKVGAAGHISSEEFEPFCKWQREEAHDTLIVHLPEFKKEQLKVYITNRGILKVSGERSVNFGKNSKFYKEVVVPGSCNTNGIQAKFANSQLFIIMPKNTNVVVPEQQNKPEQGVDQNAEAEASKDQSKPDKFGSQKEKMVSSPTPKITTQNGNTSTKIDNLEGKPASVSRGKQLGKMAVNVGLGVAVLVALMAFVVYMYKSTLLED